MLVGCSPGRAPSATPQPAADSLPADTVAVLPPPPPLQPESRPILPPARIEGANLNLDSLLASLTVRQKVGQLIMPWLLGNYAGYDSDDYAGAYGWVDSQEVGGILISVGSPLDVATRLNVLQRRSRLPLLIGADLEWGTAMRLIGGTAFPMVMGIGATGQENDAYQLGRVTAREARAVGIHLSFTPVADVNNNPLNPIINTRSFGEDPRAAARLVAAYVRGAEEHGLRTTAKHFPGHGDTHTDTHIGIQAVDACWPRLDTLELLPFRAAITAGVTGVMTAHVALPCLGVGRADTVPATLSPAIMSGVLRDSLRFGGLVVTDALSMGAIQLRYGPGEVAVRAFLAGSDLLLDPVDVRAVSRAMVTAVESGRIPRERLDASVRRILELKRRAGLFEQRTVPLDSVPAVVGQAEFQRVADDVAARSLTLVQRGAIDTFRGSRGRVGLVVYAEETNLNAGNVLARELRWAGDTITMFRLYPASGAASYDSARAIAARSSRILFAVSVRFIAGRGHVSMPDSLASLIAGLYRQKPTVLASLGSPYLLSQLPGYTGAYLLAWSDAPSTERAVAGALARRAPVTGRLPITLGPHRRGSGIQIP